MARPRKEGMDYFPHDTDATNDKKVKALRMLYGNDGYAFYFILLEMIYREPTFELDVSDAETIQILSQECGINAEVFNQILKTAMKRECFDSEAYEERRVLTSNGIKKRASLVVEKRQKMRDSYGKKVSDDVSDAETGVEMPQSKSKVKDIDKEKKDLKTIYAEQVSLTDDEYKKLIVKYGSEEIAKTAIERLSNYKCSKKTKYTSDYHVLIGWVYDDFVKRKLVVLNGGVNNGHVISDSGSVQQHSEPEPDWNKFVYRGPA